MLSACHTLGTGILSANKYKLKSRPRTTIANFDALSLLPLSVSGHPTERTAEVVSLESAYPRVLLAPVVAQGISKDSTLAKLREYFWSRAELHHSELGVEAIGSSYNQTERARKRHTVWGKS